MEEQLVKLYDQDYTKPELSDDTLSHYGILGMKWGERRFQNPDGSYTEAGKKRYGRGSGKKKEKTYSSNKEALDARDLEYIQKHKSDFSTKEMNDLMNRINTEQRLDDMVKKQSSKSKQAVSKILKSNTFKAIATVSVATVGIIGYSYLKNMWGYPRRLPDKSMPFSFLDEIKRVGKGVGGVLYGKQIGKAKKLASLVR